jgi:hypothetical protein
MTLMNECSECGKAYLNSPYYTAGRKHIFCGAECGLKWYIRENKDREVSDD